MSQDKKTTRPDARVAKGFRDIEAAELAGLNDMLQTIRLVYERYGFDALETPALEYTDALGKFLPDQDRPNAGVFSFQDEDEQWMSLRYDLTAPLARYVAQNFQTLPKPFRRYAFGNVYRNEKPGPGRFRQFMQFDADTVGSDSIAADAEMCMLAADTLEALGVKRGDYVIKVNSRKIYDGTFAENKLQPAIWDAVLRSVDKRDRIGMKGVQMLLHTGRKDESGASMPGVNLPVRANNEIMIIASATATWAPGIYSYADKLIDFPERPSVARSNDQTIEFLKGRYRENVLYQEGVSELEQILRTVGAAGYGDDRIRIETEVVRGLGYYTGPVFEAELTFEVIGDDGKPVRFGSVGGGGRYDDLVARFTGEKVPATGFSIGVSRLQAALSLINQNKKQSLGPVVVLVMDKGPAEIATYQKMTQMLRDAGIRAEMYLGSSGMKAQVKYADKRNSPCVIIQGSDERAKGEVTIKDLIEGAKAAAAIKDNKEWKAARPAQITVPEADLVAEVRKIIAQHQA